MTADLPAGTMQAKATTACLECHEARIILQQRLSKAAWTKEVDKMVKWGAPVDPNDRDALIDYLSSNFSPDKPAYEPQRTSGGKSGSGRWWKWTSSAAMEPSSRSPTLSPAGRESALSEAEGDLACTAAGSQLHHC